MFCTTSTVYEFTGMNQGIQESDNNDFDVYMYGTNLDAAGILSEQIVHLKLFYDAKTEDYDFKINVDSFGLHTILDRAIPQGFFWTDAN